MKRTLILCALGVLAAFFLIWIISRNHREAEPAARSAQSEQEPPVNPAAPRAPKIPKRRDPAQIESGTGEICGTVYQLDGAAAFGAEISVQRTLDVSSSTAFRTSISRHTTSDTAGKFSIAKLANGPYSVTARLGEAYAVESARLAPQQDRAEVVLVLFPGKPLSGRVFNEEGEGVPFARLAPVFHDKAQLKGVESNALAVDADGAGDFVIPGIEPRAWNFYVTADGYAPKLSDDLLAGTSDNDIVLGSGVPVSGVVRDDATDAPVEGVWVSASPKDLAVTPVRAISDAHGAFAFSGLEQGKYVIDVDSAPLVLANGPVEFAVEGTPTPIELRVIEGGTISGRVVDGATGQPIGGATLRARPTEEGLRTLEANSNAEDGEFEFAGVPVGEYTVFPRLVRGYPNSRDARQSAQVMVAPGERAEVELSLFRDTSISGVVISAEGQPMSGATVRGDNETWQEDTTSGPDGAFTLGGIKNECDVVVGANTSEMSSPHQAVHVPIEGVTDVIIRLDVNRNGSIAGSLVDPQGRPVRVRIFAWGMQRSPNLPGMANSAPDGRFLIANLIADEYRIIASMGNGNPYQLTTVSLAVGQKLRDLHLVFPAEGSLTIAGKVVDSENNPLIASIICERIGETPNGYFEQYFGAAESLRDGTFEVGGLAEGVYKLSASAPGYSPQSVEAAAGQTDVTITVNGKMVLAGAIVDAHTQDPVTTFDIAVLEHSGTPNASEWRTVSSPHGQFEIPCDAGDYVVTARAAGYQLRHVSVLMTDGSPSQPVRIALTPGEASVKGQIVDGGGKPVVGATLFLGPLSPFPEYAQIRSVAHSDSDGRFEITGLAEGTHTISVFHETAGTGSTSVELAGSNARPAIEIALSIPGGIEGRVMADNQPVAGVRIFARSESGTIYGATTGEDGTFRFPRVATGDVSLRLELTGHDHDESELSRQAYVTSGSVSTVDFDLTELEARPTPQRD